MTSRSNRTHFTTRHSKCPLCTTTMHKHSTGLVYPVHSSTQYISRVQTIATPRHCGCIPKNDERLKCTTGFTSSNTTHSISRIRSAPLYSIDLRISVVMMRHEASGLIDTSPVINPTSPNLVCRHRRRFQERSVRHGAGISKSKAVVYGKRAHLTEVVHDGLQPTRFSTTLSLNR